MTFEWERSAYNGDPIPPDLPFMEHTLYLTIREIYRQYRMGSVTRDVASQDKQRAIHAYEAECRKYDVLQRAGEKSVRAWNTASDLVDKFHLEPSVELAMEIIKEVWG